MLQCSQQNRSAYHKTSDRSPRLLSVQASETPGLYAYITNIHSHEGTELLENISYFHLAFLQLPGTPFTDHCRGFVWTPLGDFRTQPPDLSTSNQTLVPLPKNPKPAHLH